jgi:ankyrin repeat protein
MLLLSDWEGCGSADTNLARASDGATPLYVACQRAHSSCIRLLLAKGADPNKKRKGGYTPLWTACDRGHQVKIIHPIYLSL